MKRFFLRVAWFIGLLGLGFSLYMHLRGKDLPPQAYPELEVLRVEVPETANAFPLFLLAAEHSTLGEHKDLIDSSLADHSRESEFMDLMLENAVAVGFLRKGLEKEACQAPELHGLSDVAPYIEDWVLFSSFLEASSQNARKRGQMDEAIDKAVLLLRFSGKIYAEPESLIQFLVGTSSLNSGLTAAQALARNPEASVADLEKLQQVLAGLPPLRPAMFLTIKQEYKFVDHWIRDLAEGALLIDDSPEKKPVITSKYMFQPNRTRATAAAYFMGCLEEGKKPYSEIDFSRFERAELPEGAIRRILQPNPIGYLMMPLILPSQDSFSRLTSRAETQLNATRLMVVLQLMKREGGVFPQELGSVGLTDPFDGNDFRYDPKKRIVYSVGANGTDEGGSEILINGSDWENENEEKKRWNAEDLVFHLE